MSHSANPWKVLLLVEAPSHYPCLSQVASLLASSPLYDPLLVFYQPFDGLESCIADARRAGLDHRQLSEKPRDLVDEEPTSLRERGDVGDGRPLPSERAPSLLARGATSFRQTPLYLPAAIFRWTRHLLRQRKRFSRVLQEQAADLIVLAEDNVAGYSAVWIDASNRLGIPSLIVPFTVAKGTEAASAYFKRRDRSTNRVANWLLALVFPQWAFRYRGRKLVRLPASQAVSMELMRIAPPRPWVLHSGYSSAVAVESPRMMEHYIGEGLSKDKLRLTGSLTDDILHEHLQDEAAIKIALRRSLGVEGGQAVVACALPPNQFGALPSPIEFECYEELVDCWLRVLRNAPVPSVVIRPHPREAHLYKDGERRDGLLISLRATSELLAACDIYIASVSATIRWAIAAGKPTLNYDVYRYRYDDYTGVPGVITVEDSGSFAEIANKLVSDGGFREELRQAQLAVSRQWGILDGSSGGRLLALVHELCLARRAVERASF